MKRLFFMLALSAGLLTLGTPVPAAVDSTDILIKVLVDKGIITEEDAAAVRAEIANIRQDEEAAKKSFTVTSKKPVKVSGYLQERFTQTNQPGVNDTFEAKRVRLSLAGDATELVDFKVQVDFAGSRKGLTGAKLNNGSLTTTNGIFSKPTLLDAYVGYKLAGDSKVTLGQFKIPFSYENLLSSTNLDFILRSQVVEALVPGRDTGNQGRDVGLQFAGFKTFDEEGTKQLEYYAGLFNGSGIDVLDDNSRKDLAARVVYRPGIEGLQLGASFYNGALTPSKLVHNRTGGELVYFYGPWAVKGEYIWGKDANVHKSGWYASLLRNFSPAFQGGIRFDWLNPNTIVENDATTTLTAGINYFLNKDGYTRLQLNYQRLRAEGVGTLTTDQVLAQFQAGF